MLQVFFNKEWDTMVMKVIAHREETFMQYRTDKRAGRKLSALGFGCMRLPKEKDAEKAILAALEAGVNYFDTAYAYAGNEELLGSIITRNNIREQMLIATKLPHGKCKKPDDARELFETSLARLQTDHVEYYLIHNLVSLEQWQRVCELSIEEWIASEKASGRIGSIGFSFHGTYPEFEKLLNAYDWDFCQIQYNYLNENYQAGRAGLELAGKRGLPVIIMEPLLGGKLVSGLPKEAERALLGEESARLDSATKANLAAAWGLRWLMDQPQVTCVLSGMGSVEQLASNCAVAELTTPSSMTAEEHAAIESAKKAISAAFKIGCTGCNYCMPCPAGISIPASFAAYNESFSLGWFTGVFHYMISAGVGDAKPHFATDCMQCGACKAKCPQHLDIPEGLKLVTRRLQPPGFKAAASVYNKITT